MQLSQVVGIITGAAQGMGKAFAEVILIENGKVLITDIDEKLLTETGEEFAKQYGKENVCWMQQDVCDPTSYHKAFEFAVEIFEQDINLLVNNAGISGDFAFFNQDAPMESWQKLMDVNLNSVIRGCQVGIQQMRKADQEKEKVIINIASAAGITNAPNCPHYGAAKAGVVSLTRSLSNWKKTNNIRVAAMCPVFVDTRMGRLALGAIPQAVKATGGLISLDDIMKAFTELMVDEENAGQVMKVVNGYRGYHKFTGFM